MKIYCKDCRYYRHKGYSHLLQKYLSSQCLYRVINQYNLQPEYEGSLSDNKNGDCKNYKQIEYRKKMWWQK